MENRHRFTEFEHSIEKKFAIRGKFKIFLESILIDLGIIVLLPFVLLLSLFLIAFTAFFTIICLPVQIYKTNKYNRILIYNLIPSDMEYIIELIKFYKNNKIACSDLVKNAMSYIDKIFMETPQEYVEYRYNFCIFIGKICKKYNDGEILNNKDVYEYLEKENFKNCKDPKYFWKKLTINDIIIFEE